MKERKAIGLCIGSSTVSMVERSDGTVGTKTKRHGGKPYEAVQGIISNINPDACNIVATGRNLSGLTVPVIDEVEAVERVLCEYDKENLPDAILSFGGQTILAYLIDRNTGQITATESFNKCGSGTGEFFLQQIKRIGFTSLEEAISVIDQIALDHPYMTAHRCSVFCKSDITHACNEQKATPAEIVAGLCKMIADKSAELLTDENFNPLEKAIVNGETPQMPSGSENGKAEITEEKNHSFNIKASAPGLVIISDTWYPKWKARINGQESNVYRVNNSMRGVISPSAGSEIEVYYDEGNIKTFLVISLITLLGVFCYGTYDYFRKVRNETEKNT